MNHPFRLRKSCIACPLIFMVCAVVACAGGSSQSDPSWKSVPITDVSMVVGEWDGTITKDKAMFPEGAVRLIIRANSTYISRVKPCPNRPSVPEESKRTRVD